MVALAGRLYVLGGFTASGSIVATVEVYDPKANVWTTAAPLPRPLHHANAAVVGDRLYILGALVGAGFIAIGDGYAYDASNNSWSGLGSMPAETERGAGGTGVIGTKIYIAGGYRRGSVADFSAYDTASGAWERLPDLPEARDHLVGGVAGGKLYAVGGRRNGSLRGNVDEFDPKVGSWVPRAPMLTARAGCAGAVLGSGILVAGGEGNPSDPISGMFSEHEVYDAALDQWFSLEPMLTPRHGTGGATVGNTFFVPGGAVRQGFAATAIHEAYTASFRL